MGEGKNGQQTGPTSSVDEADRARIAQEAFERGLVERGEAAVADEHGRLPPKATHEIVGYDDKGRPILKRRRFSLAK